MKEFKTRDSESYDSVADNFDLHTEKYSQYAVDAILSSVELPKADSLVDIGCGTGILTLAAARSSTPPKLTTGIDLSDGMLAYAEAKASRIGVSERTSFLKCDAENLELEDASTDGVMSLYAFRHLPNPGKAAAEAFRVLKPNGRIAVAVGSGPNLISMGGLKSALARVPRFLAKATGRELTACDYIDHLVETHLPVTDGDEISSWSAAHHEFSGSLSDVIQEAGFADISRTWMGREYRVEKIEDFWDLQATFSSTARKRIGDADSADVDGLKSAFWSGCEEVLARNGRLVYRVGAAIVAGRKPG